MAHVDAGKTTLAERILYYCGVVRKIGSVDAGTAALDDLPQEQQKGITISAAATTVYWTPTTGPQAAIKHRINMIDTPGHVDFTVEVERSLRVLDGAVAVFDAAHGVEPQSETVWHQADRYRVARVAFINKMDKPGADFAMCVKSIRDRLDALAVPVQLPYFDNDQFVGVIDLCTMRLGIAHNNDGTDLRWSNVPANYQSEASSARAVLVEQCAEWDDAVLAQWDAHSTDRVDASTLMRAIRTGVLHQQLVPVLCGSAAKNKGVQPLLDAVANYLPSHTDREAIEGLNPLTNSTETRISTLQAPLCALVFKITHHSYLGPLAFVRLYSGSLQRGQAVYDARRQRSVRVGRVLRIHARQTDELAEAHAGDIVALAGLEGLRTGDTLSTREHPLVLESLVVPEPVVQCTIEPKTAADRDRLGEGLARLSAEDPSIRIGVDPESGTTMLEGLGELHLEITVDRLLTEYRVEATLGRPAVAYRETITKECIIHERLKKQNGGPGMFADITINVRPAPRDSGLTFEDHTHGGVLSKEFVQAVHRGIKTAMTRGHLRGYPVVDVAVELLDGATHSNDSSAMAFEAVGAAAMAHALGQASSVLLEPWMALTIVVPSEHVGVVIGDLASRKGRVRAMSVRGTNSVILGEAPMSTLFQYVTDLRGRTHGRASASMNFARYEQAR
jgi:elongation factor G